MDLNQPAVNSPNKIEVRMIFEREKGNEFIVERVKISDDAPMKHLCESILTTWGKHPHIDDINFILAQDDKGSILITRPDLVKYVSAYSHTYA